jgi:quinoprotein dehydrogenase-associated probable ABC transporter substrate-binding protein
MSAARISAALAILLASSGAGHSAPAPSKVFAVCADPSNLPYSDEREGGFENRIAALLAADLNATLRYTWNMERRSFLRRTLKAHACDVVMAAPTGLPALRTTRPYFTSSYVFVTARSADLHLNGFDDPALRQLRIGLQLVGADGANTPPAMSLARRGITANVRGYPMWDAEDVVNPQGRVIDAVADGEIDVAIVWGPFAGYFAKAHKDALSIAPVMGDPALPGVPFAFSMSIGVRQDDAELAAELEGALDRHRDEIHAILVDYGVPLAPAEAAAQTLTVEPK